MKQLYYSLLVAAAFLRVAPALYAPNDRPEPQVTFKIVPESWKPVFTNPTITYTRDTNGNIEGVTTKSTNDVGMAKIDVKVEINVANATTAAAADAEAQKWELFLYQNIVALNKFEAVYDLGIQQTHANPVPGLDVGTNIPARAPFTTNNQQLAISLKDSPGYTLLPRWRLGNPGTDNSLKATDTQIDFITWLFARNKVTGERRYLRWIKWKVRCKAVYNFNNNPPETKDPWSVDKVDEGDGQGTVAPVDTQAVITTDP